MNSLRARHRPTTRTGKLYGRNNGKMNYEDGFDNRDGQDTEREMNSGAHSMWSVSGYNFYPCEKTEKELPPGQYIPMFSEHRGVFWVQKQTSMDELLILPDSKTEQVLTSVNYFWTREEAFRKHGLLWKRGLLLWGPPGSGKTSCLQQISSQIVDLGGLSIYCNNPTITAEALRILRVIEPLRPVVVMLEDLDSIVDRFGEADLLALLDGELQIDNVVFIATTNYPENLDKRFICRPSRFDEVIYIGMPKASARREYLVKKNPRLLEVPEQLDYWVSTTKGFSIAQLKEVIVAVECLECDLDKTVERLRKMVENKPSSQQRPDEQFGIGFMPLADDTLD